MLQDPQEVLLGNQAGAGTGQKNSPWSDGLHCQLVDIKIAPLRFFKPIPLSRPFWRIDDDDLEGLNCVPLPLQVMEDVLMHPLDAGSIEVI